MEAKNAVQRLLESVEKLTKIVGKQQATLNKHDTIGSNYFKILKDFKERIEALEKKVEGK
jgi:hypothetical protein